MALINDISDAGSITREELRIFTILLNPFAPHVTEEMWQICSLGSGLVAQQQWPQYDEEKCKEDTVEIAVQISGKLRARVCIAADADEAAALAAAKAQPKIAAAIENRQVIKEIYVRGKLVNIVVK